MRDQGGHGTGGSRTPSDAATIDAPVVLRADDLRKTFPDRRGGVDLGVLDGLRFDVREREFVSVLGPSGCGKTTLLRIAQGLERSTGGTVSIAGARVDGPSPLAVTVFQHFNLFPWFTVAENVAFGLDVAGTARAVSNARVADFVRLVGLETFAGHYPHELSGGMRQRVGLARALVVDRPLLLMDEPFGALDAMTREVLQHEVAAILARAPRTVVLVTHSLDEALFLSDRVLVLSQRPARIVADVPVDLPRPRHADGLRADVRFAQLRRHLWSLLSAEGTAS